MNCANGAYFSSCGYFLSCLTTFGFAVRLITAPFLPGGDFGFSLGRGSNPRLPPLNTTLLWIRMPEA